MKQHSKLSFSKYELPHNTFKKVKRNFWTKENGPFLFTIQILCSVHIVCTFFGYSKLIPIVVFFQWNNKDQLKLFILKLSQWTTKWSSIDHLPIVIVYQRWKRISLYVFFWTRRYNDIVFKPHINNNHSQSTTTIFSFCAAFLSAI